MRVLNDEELRPSKPLQGLLTNLAKGETSEQWVIENIAYENKLKAQAQHDFDMKEFVELLDDFERTTEAQGYHRVMIPDDVWQALQAEQV